MADAERKALLEQFQAITGVDSSRATFFLESHNWDLDMALSSHFDSVNEPGDEVAGEQGTSGGASGSASSEARPDPAASRQQKPPGIRTIRGLMDEQSDSSDEDGQAFYAGGSEHSGQQILGPKRGKKSGEEIVKEMFKAARDHGAEEVDPSAEGAAARGRQQADVFTGTGYRLGQTGLDAEVIPAAPDTRPPQPRTVKLKLWKTGFSVDDGDLRDFSDPANQQFLNAIRAGQVPMELIREAKGGEVHLDMEDHREEDFVKPKPKLKPFSGAGHVLGSPAPRLAGEPPAASGGDVAGAESAALAALRLDAQQPSTSVQVRLADGSRLVVRLNHSHTVGDLRQYICTARPQYGSVPFSLMTTFPSKELNDEKITIKDAQLLNAAVLQRLK